MRAQRASHCRWQRALNRNTVLRFQALGQPPSPVELGLPSPENSFIRVWHVQLGFRCPCLDIFGQASVSDQASAFNLAEAKLFGSSRIFPPRSGAAKPPRPPVFLRSPCTCVPRISAHTAHTTKTPWQRLSGGALYGCCWHHQLRIIFRPIEPQCSWHAPFESVHFTDLAQHATKR